MIVYITTNLINGRKYIGKDVTNRKYYLGSGKALKLAINKYGKHNFKKEILGTVNTKQELEELEIYYINYYNACNSELFYNIAKGGLGGGANGRVLSNETKAKMSASAKRNITSERRLELIAQLNKNHPGKGRFGKDNYRSITVYQYDLFGNFIKQYDSLTIAASQTNSQVSKISNCLKSKRKTTNGYIWSTSNSLTERI